MKYICVIRFQRKLFALFFCYCTYYMISMVMLAYKNTQYSATCSYPYSVQLPMARVNRHSQSYMYTTGQLKNILSSTIFSTFVIPVTYGKYFPYIGDKNWASHRQPQASYFSTGVCHEAFKPGNRFHSYEYWFLLIGVNALVFFHHPSFLFISHFSFLSPISSFHFYAASSPLFSFNFQFLLLLWKIQE